MKTNRQDGRRECPWRFLEGLGAFGLYLGASTVYLGLQIIPHLSKVSLPGGDSLQFMWFLSWWPYALAHGVNPFITKMMFAPVGFNLTWATSVPTIALLAAPLTNGVGPIAAFNIVMLAAPALSALSAFILCRYVTRAFAPSLVGGLLFGFSSYELAQFSAGHLNLVFVCWFPLAILLCLLLYDRRLRPSAFAALLVLIVALQLGTSAELLATATLFGAIALATALVVDRDRRRDLVRLAGYLLVGYLVAALVIFAYLYYAYIGLQAIPPVIWDADWFSADLVNYFMPTTLTWVGGTLFAPLTTRFTGNLGEQGAYLGLPIFLLALVAAIKARRAVGGKVLAVSGIVAAVASLGPVFHVLGHGGRLLLIRLPWTFVEGLPVLRYALPARFVLYVTLAVSLAVAWWLRHASAGRSIKAVLAIAGIACLAPVVGSPRFQAKIDVPSFFADHTYTKYLRPGDIALLVPYRDIEKGLLWQAMGDMYFRWASGYASYYPPDTGLGNARPIMLGSELARWPLLVSLQSGTRYPGYGPALEQFLFAHDVRFVIAVGPDRGRWDAFLSPILGPGKEVDGVTLYEISRARSARRPDTVAGLENR